MPAKQKQTSEKPKPPVIPPPTNPQAAIASGSIRSTGMQINVRPTNLVPLNAQPSSTTSGKGATNPWDMSKSKNIKPISNTSSNQNYSIGPITSTTTTYHGQVSTNTTTTTSTNLVTSTPSLNNTNSDAIQTAVMERELLLILHQLRERDGYVMHYRYCNRIKNSTKLEPILRAKGIGYPYRSLGLVEGVLLIEQESILVGNSMMLTNILTRPKDIERQVLRVIMLRLKLLKDFAKISSSSKTLTKFKDLGVGRLQYSPHIRALYRTIVPPYSLHGIDEPIWFSATDLLSILQENPDLSWDELYNKTAEYFDVDIATVAVPRSGMRPYLLKSYRKKLDNFTQLAETNIGAAAKKASRRQKLLTTTDSTEDIPTNNVAEVSTVPNITDTSSSILQNEYDGIALNALDNVNQDSKLQVDGILSLHRSLSQNSDIARTLSNNSHGVLREEENETLIIPTIPSFIQSEIFTILESVKQTVAPEAVQDALRAVISAYYNTQQPEDIVPALKIPVQSITNVNTVQTSVAFKNWLDEQHELAMNESDQTLLNKVVSVGSLQYATCPQFEPFNQSLSVAQILDTVPPLEDADEWLNWTTIYAASFGPLSKVLKDENICLTLQLKNIRFLEVVRGVFIRLLPPEKCSTNALLHAMSYTVDVRYIAAIVVSMVTLNTEGRNWYSSSTYVAGILEDSFDAIKNEELSKDVQDLDNAKFLIRIIGYLPNRISGIISSTFLHLLFDKFEIQCSKLPQLIHEMHTHEYQGVVANGGANDTNTIQYGYSNLLPCRPLQNMIAALGYAISTSSGYASTATNRSQINEVLQVLINSLHNPSISSLKTTLAKTNPLRVTNVNPSNTTQINTNKTNNFNENITSSTVDNKSATSTTTNNLPVFTVEHNSSFAKVYKDLGGPEFGSAIRPQNFVDAQKVVERMRIYWMLCDQPSVDNPMSNVAHKNTIAVTTHLGAGNLYEDATHFLHEMLQNADDNEYTEGSDATVQLCCESTSSTGSVLVVYNNELGFRVKDIEAVCQSGGSTKTTAGYIGKKGIGWKSVFAVSRTPEIHSGYAHFKFDIRPKEEGGLDKTGQLAPLWINNDNVIIPDTIANALQFNNDNIDKKNNLDYIPGTIIRLPFGNARNKQLSSKSNAKDLISFPRMEDALSGLLRTPSMLLFMRKLKTICVTIQREEMDGTTYTHKRQLHRLPDEPLDLSTRFSNSELHVAYVATVIESDFGVNMDDKRDIVHKWLVYKCKVPLNQAPSRAVPTSLDAEYTEVVLAFPLNANINESKNNQNSVFVAENNFDNSNYKDKAQYVFAFLPIDTYGFNFVLQADWILPATRENITKDNEWNDWLANDVFPTTLMDSIHVFQAYFYQLTKVNDLDTLSKQMLDNRAMMAYLCHFPGNNAKSKADGIFHRGIISMYNQLKKIPCLPIFLKSKIDYGNLSTPEKMVLLNFPQNLVIRSDEVDDPKQALIFFLEKCGIDFDWAQEILGVRFLHPDVAAKVPKYVIEQLGINPWTLTLSLRLLTAVYTINVPDHYTHTADTNSWTKKATEKFIAWCRLFWTQKPTSHNSANTTNFVTRLLSDSNERCPWIPDCTGKLSALDIHNPILYVDSSLNNDIFIRLANIHPKFKILHPEITNQFKNHSWIKSCCQWLGIVSLDLRSTMENIIIPLFTSIVTKFADPATSSESNIQASNNNISPLEEKSIIIDKLLLATTISRLWWEQAFNNSNTSNSSHSSNNSSENNKLLLQILRSVIVIITNNDQYLRLKHSHDDEIPLLPDSVFFPIQREYIHISSDMVIKNSPVRTKLKYLELCLGYTDKLGTDAFIKPLWYTVSPLYLSKDNISIHKDTNSNNNKERKMREWVNFFNALGITDTFYNLPTENNSSQRDNRNYNLLIPSAVLRISSNMNRENDDNNTDEASELTIQDVCDELFTIIRMFNEGNSSVESKTSLQTKAAGIAILYNLRHHLNLHHTHSKIITDWLRHQLWLPIIIRSGENYQPSSSSSLLVNPTKLAKLSLAPVYGNWMDYVDENSLTVYLSQCGHSPQDFILDKTNETSDIIFDKRIGLVTEPSSELSQTILLSIVNYNTNQEHNGDIVFLTPDIRANRWVPKPWINLNKNNNVHYYLDIQSSTLCCVGDILRQIYGHIKLDNEDKDIPLAIPTHLQRINIEQHDTYGGALYCRFAKLSDGNVIHDDGVNGLLKEVDIWSVWDIGKVSHKNNRNFNDKYNDLALYPPQTAIYDHIRQWSHSNALSHGNKTNEYIAWTTALKRLQTKYDIATTNNDSNLRLNILRTVYAILLQAMTDRSQRSMDNDNKNRCIQSETNFFPKTYPFLLPATIIYGGKDPIVQSSTTITDGTNIAISSNIANNASPSNVNNTTGSLNSSPSETDELPTLLYYIEGDKINDEIVFVMDDNYNIVPRMRQYYSKLPLNRGPKVILLHLPNAFTFELQGEQRNYMRTYLYNDMTIRAISLSSRPLIERAPLGAAVKFTTLTGIKKYAWANVCKALQVELQKYDSYLYDTVQNKGIISDALKTVVNQDSTGLTSRLTVDYILPRTLINGSEFIFIVYTTNRPSQIIENGPSWILYIDESYFGIDTMNNKIIKDNPLNSTQQWCNAAVQFVLAQCQKESNDNSRLAQLKNILENTLRNVIPNETKPLSNTGNKMDNTNLHIVPSSATTDPHGILWYNPDDLKHHIIVNEIPPEIQGEKALDADIAEELTQTGLRITAIAETKNMDSDDEGNDKHDNSNKTKTVKENHVDEDEEESDNDTDDEGDITAVLALGEDAVEHQKQYLLTKVKDGTYRSLQDIPKKFLTGIENFNEIEELINNNLKNSSKINYINLSNTGLINNNNSSHSHTNINNTIRNNNLSIELPTEPNVSLSSSMLNTLPEINNLERSLSNHSQTLLPKSPVTNNNIDDSNTDHKIYDSNITTSNINNNKKYNGKHYNDEVQDIISATFIPYSANKTPEILSKSINNDIELDIYNNPVYKELLFDLTNISSIENDNLSNNLPTTVGNASRMAHLTGRAAEFLVNHLLQQELLKNNTMKIEWVNEHTESGNPYDFIIQKLNTKSKQYEIIRYIEVKGTRKIQQLLLNNHTTNSNNNILLNNDNNKIYFDNIQFPISPTEISFAVHHSNIYELYCVTGVGIYGASRLTRINNFITSINQSINIENKTTTSSTNEDTNTSLHLYLELVTNNTISI